jgi:UDP-N-acetylmuramoyl-tripeptide--D-alanyl-D-alanine ligase
MISFTGTEISHITHGQLLCDFTGKDFCIDSRLVKKGDVFLALPGATYDGHNFIENALQAGAAGVIAKFKPDTIPANAPIVLVEDVRTALLTLAQYKRQHSIAKFIAVTGSVGKTSTKEMLKLALDAQEETFVNFGNYNNDLGVPICMASIPKTAKFVVLEAGMNNPGEISYLSQLIQPDIAIITTVAPVHLWKFENVAGIAREKASIVDGMKKGAIALLNDASQEFQEVLSYVKNKKLSTNIIGKDRDAEILEQKITPHEIHLKARIFDQVVSYKLSHTAQQQVINSLFVLLTIQCLGLDLNKAAQALYSFKLTKGRGEVRHLKSGAILIDDSYNSNPASLSAAFENLASYQGKKLAIVADMLELGKDAPKLHKELYKPELFKQFDGIIAMGNLMHNFYDILPKHLQKGYFPNLEALQQNLANLIKGYDVILVKGSRGTGLYKIIDQV